MRKTETIELGEGDQKIEITIKELTVEQIIAIFDKWKNVSEDEADDAGTLKQELEDVFKLTVSGVGFDQLTKYAPSEIRSVWDTFEKVNGVFFEAVNSLGIMDTLKELIGAIKDDFLKIFQGSSKEVTPTS